MAEPFLGEVRLASFAFTPRGWAACNGQLLPINQNQALFSLLGTTYGGDGRTTFALPDLRGCVPMHVGGTLSLGAKGGEQTHTLTPNELPAHQHTLRASADIANTGDPTNALPAAKPRGGVNIYSNAGAADRPLAQGSIGPAGSSQPHPNMQPYLTVNFIIAMQGIFPSQN